MKNNGLRLLLVGFESGRRPDPAQHQEGIAHRHCTTLQQRLPQARHFGSRYVHPWIAGETGKRSRRPSISRRNQPAHDSSVAGGAVSRHHPVQAGGGQRLATGKRSRQPRERQGVQLAAISYPHLSKEEIFHSMEDFYKRFYFRPKQDLEIVREMLSSWDMMKRRLREGVEFFRFLARTRLRTSGDRPDSPCRSFIQ